MGGQQTGRNMGQVYGISASGLPDVAEQKQTKASSHNRQRKNADLTEVVASIEALRGDIGVPDCEKHASARQPEVMQRGEHQPPTQPAPLLPRSHIQPPEFHIPDSRVNRALVAAIFGARHPELHKADQPALLLGQQEHVLLKHICSLSGREWSRKLLLQSLCRHVLTAGSDVGLAGKEGQCRQVCRVRRSDTHVHARHFKCHFKCPGR